MKLSLSGRRPDVVANLVIKHNQACSIALIGLPRIELALGQVEVRAAGRAIDTAYRSVAAATKAREREDLGENVTRWIRANPNFRVVDKIVTQSSDREFHCLTITLFYRERPRT